MDKPIFVVFTKNKGRFDQGNVRANYKKVEVDACYGKFLN